MTNLAHLKKDSPFYELFPDGVPIINIMQPSVADCEGDGVQEVYMVDLNQLSAEKLIAVAKMVHRQCGNGVPFSDMLEEITERGLPLRAKHVQSVSSDIPFFL